MALPVDLTAYIDAVKDAMSKYALAKHELSTFTKSYNAARTSLDYLQQQDSPSDTVDADYAQAIATIQNTMNKKKDRLREMAEQVFALEGTLVQNKADCLSIMRQLLDITQRITTKVVDDHHADACANQNDALLTHCAKAMYGKFDNHDLRPAPDVAADPFLTTFPAGDTKAKDVAGAIPEPYSQSDAYYSDHHQSHSNVDISNIAHLQKLDLNLSTPLNA